LERCDAGRDGGRRVVVKDGVDEVVARAAPLIGGQHAGAVRGEVRRRSPVFGWKMFTVTCTWPTVLPNVSRGGTRMIELVPIPSTIGRSAGSTLRTVS
jgi:hypothetical protein